MTEHDTEARLRAALRAKAESVDSDGLTRANPPDGSARGRGASVHDIRTVRARLRRSAPLLVAAAAILAIAGTAAGVTAIEGDRAPADRPSPSSSPTAPVPSSSPTTPSRSVRPGGGTVGGQTGGSGRSAGQNGPGGQPPTTGTTGTPTFHDIVAAGVTLTVPGPWTVSADSKPGANIACVTLRGAPQQDGKQGENRYDNCILRVRVIDSIDVWDVDDAFPYGDPGCGSSDAAQGDYAMRSAGNATVGGETGEYRSYDAGCFQVASETWIAPNFPEVVFQRTTLDASTRASAEQAVRTARLPGARALRTFDRGVVCSATPSGPQSSGQQSSDSQSSGPQTHVTLDRVTAHFSHSPTTFDNGNTGTYAYDLPASVRIFVYGHNGLILTPAQLAQLAGGDTVEGLTPDGLRRSVLQVSTSNGVAITSATLEYDAGVSGCGS